MVATTQEIPTAPPLSRQTLPDPGERVPALSWPIVAIFVLALAVFSASTVAALTHALPTVATVAASAMAIFVMFTVLHDASHSAISRHRWVNRLFGRVAMFFVSPLISFSSFTFIHIEHHRNTNDGDSDPDHFVSASPWWQLPFRFPAMDVPYIKFLWRNRTKRPSAEIAEIAETIVLMTFSASAIIGAALTGHFWTLAVVYLIPERAAMFVLAWWFDWLPHHDLEDTQRENRYRATRNRVGAEWIMTPLLLSQNYHLVHHLHPSIPFYRYVATWRRNEAAYLERGAAIGTVFGQQLNANEYREWKKLNGKLAPVLPVRMPRSSSALHASTHPIPVDGVERLTPDSVKITFAVPAELTEQFRFQAGQHLTIQHSTDGKKIRRNYSICSPATSGTLAIGIRRIDGGAFSTYACDTLQAGDVLDLMTPTGSFGAPLEPLAVRDYVAVAAGSGITPILSIIATTMAIETESRFTLIYGNRTADTTMFAPELDDLEARYVDRLRVIHVRSGDPHHPTALRGRIDYPLLRRVLGEAFLSVDRWYLCGPAELVTDVRSDLIADGVDEECVNLELFRGADRHVSDQEFTGAQLTIALSGTSHSVELAPGETVLEAALKNDIDAPYSCLGGACGTCKAKLVAGTVTMEQNFALTSAEVAAGYVLTCQSHPTVDALSVDYDG